MAIFHLSVKPISRSAGRSATAAAAYRAGEKILDERTGEIHDYARRGGVETADLVLPDGAPEWASDRAKLWNAAELVEKRKDACVAREYEVALPAELAPAERRALALDFARDMANREGCAVDVAIHAPGRGGDNRNHHAHILRTTRKLEADGLGAKLDTEKAGRKRADDLEAVRSRWAELTNAHLERAGVAERIDHRSLKEQGIEREPTQHLGPAATGYERRTGEPSDNRTRQEQQAAERLDQAELGQLERQESAAADAIEGIETAIVDALNQNLEDRIQAIQEAHLKAERERDQEEREKAERERIERMSAAELRAEIARIRPLPLMEAVDRQPEVVKTRKHSEDLEREAQQKRTEGAEARREGQRWRDDHILRAKAHDAGWMRSKVLLETETRHQNAKMQWQELAPRAEAAKQEAEHVRSNTRHRVAQEQAPELEKVAKLERLEREKQTSERAALAMRREQEAAIELFKEQALRREMKERGYSDNGKLWNAIAESMRGMIDTYNSWSREEKPIMLDTLRARMKSDPSNMEKMREHFSEVEKIERSQDREIDRGMER